jgi:protein TonB
VSDLLHDHRPLERSYYRRVQLAILVAAGIHVVVLLAAPPYVPSPYRLQTTPLRLVTALGPGVGFGTGGGPSEVRPVASEPAARAHAPVLTEQLRFSAEHVPRMESHVTPSGQMVPEGVPGAAGGSAGLGSGGEGELDASPSVFYAFDTPPRMVERVVPEYPAVAKAQGSEGTVVLNANVDERGRVLQVWVARATAPEILIEAAVDALYRSRFAPGSQQGIPVKCTVAVPFNFRLNVHL